MDSIHLKDQRDRPCFVNLRVGMNTKMEKEVYISVVAAAYNEQQNIRRLLEEIAHAVSVLGNPWEMIIANDGSTDGTAGILRECIKEYPQLRVVSLKNRSGQTAALECALRHARGRFIATLDADLQNDPRDIPSMLVPVVSGKCDMANGWRKDRRDPWIRLLSTRIANSVRNWLTGECIRDSACGLKVFRRECIENVKFFNGMHRFLPTLVKMEGYRVVEIPVNHRPRTAGKTKYGIGNRLFRALRDAFAVRWMRSRTVLYQYEEWEREDAE